MDFAQGGPVSPAGPVVVGDLPARVPPDWRAAYHELRDVLLRLALAADDVPRLAPLTGEACHVLARTPGGGLYRARPVASEET